MPASRSRREETDRARAMWGMQRTLDQQSRARRHGRLHARSWRFRASAIAPPCRARICSCSWAVARCALSDPAGIQIALEKPTHDHHHRHRQAAGRSGGAEIRSYRPPEPYKGKGVKYASERIRRKEGKKK
jgi:large subunit ribosomal protein L6